MIITDPLLWLCIVSVGLGSAWGGAVIATARAEKIMRDAVIKAYKAGRQDQAAFDNRWRDEYGDQ